MVQQIEEALVSEVRETHAALRLVFPASEAAMVESVKIHGQLTPVVCAPLAEGLELVDGFKRLRALRKLGIPHVRLVRLDTSFIGSKAGMIRLNRVGDSLTDFEEAMILQSLHREDRLSQVELAAMLGRDKSWVSRRIALIERLGDECRRHLQCGLISPSTCRELIRLPRAIQEKTLKAVQKHHLGKRDVAKLVGRLLARPAWDHENILYYAWNLHAPEGEAPRTLEEFLKILGKVREMQCSLALSAVEARDIAPRHRPGLQTALASGHELVKRLEALLEPPGAAT